MIVILNRDVKGTGKAGEVVKVSDGYARNMLLPKGYATEATDGNIRNLEKTERTTSAEKSGRQSCGRKSSGCIRKCKSCHQDQVRGGRQTVRLDYLKRHRGGCKRTDRDYPR